MSAPKIVSIASKKSTNSELEELRAENVRLRAELEKVRAASRHDRAVIMDVDRKLGWLRTALDSALYHATNACPFRGRDNSHTTHLFCDVAKANSIAWDVNLDLDEEWVDDILDAEDGRAAGFQRRMAEEAAKAAAQ